MRPLNIMNWITIRSLLFPQPRKAEPEPSQGSFLTLPLLVLLILLAVNHNKVLQNLKIQIASMVLWGVSSCRTELISLHFRSFRFFNKYLNSYKVCLLTNCRLRWRILSRTRGDQRKYDEDNKALRFRKFYNSLCLINNIKVTPQETSAVQAPLG